MEVELGTSPYTHQKVFRSKGVERYMALINEHGAEYQVGYLSDCFARARVLNSIRVVEWKPNQILSRILFYQSTTTFWHRILTQIPWEPQKPVTKSQIPWVEYLSKKISQVAQLAHLMACFSSFSLTSTMTFLQPLFRFNTSTFINFMSFYF